MKRLHVLIPFILIAFTASVRQARAGDWPQFRHDAQRSAACAKGLPSDLALIWVRELPEPRPAFPVELRLSYDASYEPVVLGEMMFVPSMVTDSVTALDTETGEVRWRFFAEGPVRFAPVASQGKVYFVSDDGNLYCVRADDGQLLWKFRGLPEGRPDRRMIGHGRLVSLWPARGGPVLDHGVIYFAAGFWPTEGVFLHAVDAETGDVVWSNTDSAHIPASNWDHGIGHESGLTPQGYLAIVGNQLVVPCGAQLPAFLDPKTGELHTYTMGWGGRNGLPKGCWFVAGSGRYLSHGGDLYDISRPNEQRFSKTKSGDDDYKNLLYPGGWTRLNIERDTHRELDSFRQPVMTREAMYLSDRSLVARDLTKVEFQRILPEDLPAERKNDPYPDTLGGRFQKLWEMDSPLNVHIKAGHRLYLGGAGVVEAVDVEHSEPKVVWQAKLEGTPHRMLAADDKLFIVTRQGSILAFGAPRSTKPVKHGLPAGSEPEADHWTEEAKAMLEATEVREGYALVLGLESGRLVEELVRRSDLHVIAVDADPKKVDALRRRLFDAGRYGSRASVLVGDPLDYPFPPYLADLVVTETPEELSFAASPSSLFQSVYYVLRPYGGVACATEELADRWEIESLVKGNALDSVEVRQAGDFVLLTRSGALPGAADWSHAEANAACTGASEDEFIRSPMTLLWFDASQRWHKFPGQNLVRVAGGRLILLKEGVLRASDVYTGRKLWEIEVPFGNQPLADGEAREKVRYQRHRIWGPEASLPGTTQLVVVDDTIYVSDGRTCLRLDPASGKLLGRIELPADLREPWANLRVRGDSLVGTSGPHILCVHRRTGQLRWRLEVNRSALSLAVGSGKVFCSELVNPRHGEDAEHDGRMFALDLQTGEELWSREGGLPLRYSQAFDLLVTPSAFYRADDGTPVPSDIQGTKAKFVITGAGIPKTGLPAYLAGDKLLAGNEQNLTIYKLPSGKQVGETLSWVRRGCTGTRASIHLLTTRLRGNSAWVDLRNGEITPMLGIRPGCQRNNNLYPADGVLNIPNLTAGCTCNYTPASAACVPASVIKRPEK